jgi:hypothetical protein
VSGLLPQTTSKLIPPGPIQSRRWITGHSSSVNAWMRHKADQHFGHFVDWQHVIRHARFNCAAWHAIKLSGFGGLHHHHPAGRFDLAHAQCSVATGAAKNDPNGALLQFVGQRVDEEIDRHAYPAALNLLGQVQRLTANRQILVGWDQGAESIRMPCQYCPAWQKGMRIRSQSSGRCSQPHDSTMRFNSGWLRLVRWLGQLLFGGGLFRGRLLGACLLAWLPFSRRLLFFGHHLSSADSQSSCHTRNVPQHTSKPLLIGAKTTIQKSQSARLSVRHGQSMLKSVDTAARSTVLCRMAGGSVIRCSFFGKLINPACNSTFRSKKTPLGGEGEFLSVWGMTG